MKDSKLKYVCSSFSSNISIELLSKEMTEEFKYPVFGASGLIGYDKFYEMKETYLGIIKDGAGVGRINVYPPYSSILGTMAYIIPFKNISITWLKYCVLSLNLSESLDKTTIPHIYFSEYGNKKIKYCDIDEQQKIAGFLDKECGKIDETSAEIEKQIETLEELKRSIISEAVTKGLNKSAQMKDSGVSYVGKIPENWKVNRGKFIFNYVQKLVKEDDGVITCFRDGEVTLRSNRREDGFTISEKEIGYQGIDVGDLIVHGMDGFAGAIGISDSRGKASPVLNNLQTNQSKRFYMYYLRNMAYKGVFIALATGIRVRTCDTNWGKLREIYYAIPPLKEQQEIADYLDKKCAEIDSIIEEKNKQLEVLEKYKKSLIYEYVTGKKEVV